MRRFVFSVIFLVTAILLPAQPKEETVIQPRGTTSATGAGAPAGATQGTNSSFYLAAAMLAAAGGWWFWLKRKGGMRGVAGKANLLTIAETRSLGSRQYLVVADYDGRKFLLGVCPGSIAMLTPLDGEAPAPKQS